MTCQPFFGRPVSAVMESSRYFLFGITSSAGGSRQAPVPPGAGGSRQAPVAAAKRRWQPGGNRQKPAVAADGCRRAGA